MSTTRRRRWALVALVAVAAGACLALSWWQWTRYESTSGTFQNLGYAMQWPFFAAFCVIAYRKFIRLEEAPPQPDEDAAPREIPADLLPERPKAAADDDDDDPVLREYNAYLAELAHHDGELADDDRQDRTTA